MVAPTRWKTAFGELTGVVLVLLGLGQLATDDPLGLVVVLTGRDVLLRPTEIRSRVDVVAAFLLRWREAGAKR